MQALYSTTTYISAIRRLEGGSIETFVQLVKSIIYEEGVGELQCYIESRVELPVGEHWEFSPPDHDLLN